MKLGRRPFRGVGVQGELAHHQRRPVGVEEGEVHLSARVLEDAQAGNAVGERHRLGVPVAAADPEEDQESRADGAHRAALDHDRGLANALEEGSHRGGGTLPQPTGSGIVLRRTPVGAPRISASPPTPGLRYGGRAFCRALATRRSHASCGPCPLVDPPLALVACAHQQAAEAPPAPPVVAEAAPPVAEAPDQSKADDTAELKRILSGPIAHFEFDQAQLTSESRQKLQALAAAMKAHPAARIRIAGNCDELGTTEYNLALGQRRAEVAREVPGRPGGGDVAGGDHQLRRGAAGGGGPRRRVARQEPPRRRRAAQHALRGALAAW